MVWCSQSGVPRTSRFSLSSYGGVQLVPGGCVPDSFGQASGGAHGDDVPLLVKLQPLLPLGSSHAVTLTVQLWATEESANGKVCEYDEPKLVSAFWAPSTLTWTRF